MMDGPNVTQLRSKVVEECDKEARVAAGSTTRDTLAIQEAVPGEARVVSILVHLVIIFGSTRDPGQSVQGGGASGRGEETYFSSSC